MRPLRRRAKKAYCDRELKETEEKNAAKTTEIEKLSTNIDQMSAKSADFEDEVAQLQNDFAKLAKAQGEVDKLREEENTLYESNKVDVEKGLKGVKLALRSSTCTMPRRVSPIAWPWRGREHHWPPGGLRVSLLEGPRRDRVCGRDGGRGLREGDQGELR